MATRTQCNVICEYFNGIRKVIPKLSGYKMMQLKIIFSSYFCSEIYRTTIIYCLKPTLITTQYTRLSLFYTIDGFDFLSTNFTGFIYIILGLVFGACLKDLSCLLYSDGI